MRLSNKKSFKYRQKHLQDEFKNLGYMYWEKGILNRVTSPEIYSNPFLDRIYRRFDSMFVQLVHLTKQIRTQFSIAHEKDTILIN